MGGSGGKSYVFPVSSGWRPKYELLPEDSRVVFFIRVSKNENDFILVVEFECRE